MTARSPNGAVSVSTPTIGPAPGPGGRAASTPPSTSQVFEYASASGVGPQATRPARRYHFGFVLTTCLGNMTRYRILRKFAERDPEVDCTWAPIDYELPEGGRVRWLPAFLFWRWLVFQQCRPVFRHLGRLDAVMVHQFEPSVLLSLRRMFTRAPTLVSSTDETPLVGADGHPMYANELRRSAGLQRLRLAIDLWRVRRADLTLPMSAWAGRILVDDCGVPGPTVHPVPIGLDLEWWRPVTDRSPAAGTGPSDKPKILFVGGDFERKGGRLLLEVFAEHFLGRAELHLVTNAQLPPLPADVFVHTGLTAEDPRLRELYRTSDVFVLPTLSDTSSWVCLEAMASGLAVVSTRVGGIPDLIDDGRTGLLVAPADKASLTDAMARLLGDPALRRQMGRLGREKVEREFNAAVNVPRILGLMKQAVDSRMPTGRAPATGDAAVLH